MTSANSPAAIVHADLLPRRNTRLWITVVAHGVVDFFSFTAPPLLTVLEGHLHLTPEQGAMLLTIGAVCNGLVQPLVAWLSDTFNTRLFGWLGLTLAVIGVGLIGFARTYPELLLIQIASSMGIGAFHPIAAAAVGQLSAARRSFGVAIFYCAGMLGGMAGNIGAPLWVGHFDGHSSQAGLRAIAWFIPPGLFTAVALFWAIHHMPHRKAGAKEAHAELPAEERRARWRGVGILYGANVLRFAVDTALIVLITRWCEQMVLHGAGATVLTEAMRQHAAEMSGPLQAAKQLGMGVCGLLAGWYLAARHEKLALTLSPLLAAAAITLMPHMPRGLGIVCSMLAGIGYGGLVPLTISLAQRLLPHRTSLASGLMMGGAWSVSAVAAVGVQKVVDHAGLASGFYATAGVSVLAAAVTVLLPARLFRGHV